MSGLTIVTVASNLYVKNINVVQNGKCSPYLLLNAIVHSVVLISTYANIYFYITSCIIILVVRDWSLIMGMGGGGGATKREGGGHVKFYPYEKGGGGVLAMLKGEWANKV